MKTITGQDETQSTGHEERRARARRLLQAINLGPGRGISALVSGLLTRCIFRSTAVCQALSNTYSNSLSKCHRFEVSSGAKYPLAMPVLPSSTGVLSA